MRLAVIAAAMVLAAPAVAEMTRRDCAEMAAATEKSVAAFKAMVDALHHQMRGRQLSEVATGRVKAAAGEAERASAVMMPDLRMYAAKMDALAIELRACAR